MRPYPCPWCDLPAHRWGWHERSHRAHIWLSPISLPPRLHSRLLAFSASRSLSLSSSNTNVLLHIVQCMMHAQSSSPRIFPLFSIVLDCSPNLLNSTLVILLGLRFLGLIGWITVSLSTHYPLCALPASCDLVCLVLFRSALLCCIFHCFVFSVAMEGACLLACHFFCSRFDSELKLS